MSACGEFMSRGYSSSVQPLDEINSLQSQLRSLDTEKAAKIAQQEGDMNALRQQIANEKGL